MLSSDFCKLNNVKSIKVVPWSHQQHWEDIVFQGKNIWVGIEGIPLNWWNIHALKVIGAKLGGVLEIAKETLDCSFLTYAKIRVFGLSSGFLPSVLEMPWRSDSVMLGVFPLNDKWVFFQGGTGRALGSTFMRGAILRKSLADPYFPSLEDKNGLVMEARIGVGALTKDGEASDEANITTKQRSIFYVEPSRDKVDGVDAVASLVVDKTDPKGRCEITTDVSDIQ